MIKHCLPIVKIASYYYTIYRILLQVIKIVVLTQMASHSISRQDCTELHDGTEAWIGPPQAPEDRAR